MIHTRKQRPLRILLVEEGDHDFVAFERAFEKRHTLDDIIRYVRAEDALTRLLADSSAFDIVVASHDLPGMSGLEFLKELVDHEISLPLVLLTGLNSESLSVEAMKIGVDNVLAKEPSQGYLDLIPAILNDTIRKHRYRRRSLEETSPRQEDTSYGSMDEDQTELICRFLPDGTLTFANEALCRYLNMKREELIGRDFMQSIPEEEREEVRERFLALGQENPVSSIEHRVMLPNGEIRWQRWKNRALLNEKGELLEIQSVGQDISGLKKAEDALQQSEERYKSLVEITPNGFFICECESGDFLFVNQTACNLLGYSMPEVLSRSMWDMLLPEEKDTFKERVLTQPDGRSRILQREEYKIVRKDRAILKAEVYLSLVTFKGSWVFQGILREVAQEERLQNQLTQAQKMEAIGTLAGGIAHQFNNALTGITGNIGLLEIDYPDDENIAKYVGRMSEASSRMADLTGQLLAYARGGKYRPEIISLNKFVEETLPLLRYTTDPDLEVETDLSDNHCYVNIDVTQLQMTLSAILTNAAEATEGPGHIKISTAKKGIDEAFAKANPGLKPRDYVCLAVQDSGKGMDEQTRTKVFEPFFTTKFQGRGLGMAAVYGIVKNHDGWISVDSEPEEGTIVTIYLPTVEVDGEENGEFDMEIAKGSGTILVVEDEEPVIAVTRAILERLGYRVLEATTGMEAIALVKTSQEEIDLTILDMLLPDMDGKEVYSKIIQTRPHMKVIVCSGYSVDGPAQEILDKGAQGFVQKPFTITSLSSKLREVLDTGH
ncbi:MAG: response regulator [Desulfatiglans sp.]|jgi:PAS domain S-box-containing protein|nr:response regulator [Desulfatiglans sp.]